MNGIFYIVQINSIDPKINLRSKYKIGKLLSGKEFTNDIIFLGGELLFTILLSMIFSFLFFYKIMRTNKNIDKIKRIYLPIKY